jgi:hypothetical protein
MVIAWPGEDGMCEQRDCGKPATCLVNDVCCCNDCFLALLAQNDPELVASVELLTDKGTES